MTEQLQHRAKVIKDLLQQKPAIAAELLIDFARQYATDDTIEDEAILLKLDLTSPLPSTERLAVIQNLTALTDRVVTSYDPAVIADMLAKEKAIVEHFREQQPAAKTIVALKKIQKSYGRNKFSLETEDVTIRLGEITGLIGENATGKTTFLRILAGELTHDKGELTYPQFSKKTTGLDWETIKPQIAYVPQELPKWNGALETILRYEAAIHGFLGEANDHALDYIIQRLGLQNHLQKSWQELSGGYKLRFALAKALIWQPQFLILDEPLANLDIKTQLIVLQDMVQLAKSLKHPIGVLISSQHLYEIEAVADQMLFMREGKLENLGATKDFRKERASETFEFACTATLQELAVALADMPPHNLWHDGMHFLIDLPRYTKRQAFMQTLTEKGFAIPYFRDISQSVKTKFYEQQLQ